MKRNMEALLKSMGLDQYQRAAQLNPALLTVLPVTAVCLLWLPKASALVGSLASVAATAALMSLLMNYGRARGRAVQARMVQMAGGLQTSIALRHRDDHLADATRQRYHDELRRRGFAIPTAEAEAHDPDAADDVYRSVTEWLPNQTRDQKKYALLHMENRTYGFRRNLLGLKPLGLVLLLGSLLGDLLALRYFSEGDPNRVAAGWILAGIMVAGAVGWLFLVTEKFVEDAGWSYACRQLAMIDLLPKGRVKKSGNEASGT